MIDRIACRIGLHRAILGRNRTRSGAAQAQVRCILRAFIEVHPTKGTEVILVNIRDIEWVYELAEKDREGHAVLRLHGNGKDSVEVKETYDQVKTLIGQAAT
jgi:hypothetical protein